MPHNHSVVHPGKTERTVLSESGEILTPPENWAFLPAGDAAITKSVKTKGPTWVVRMSKGRREISKGIWAKEADILAAEKEIKHKRSTPEYRRKREMDLARREGKQKIYVEKFHAEVINFLNFHPRYKNVAKLLADQVTAHATPVGSGTVARTRRIPITKRAESAVIAWMRHQTTAYDSMRIARVKGKRREVRRLLAEKSIHVLRAYRQGQEIDENCSLKKVLDRDLPLVIVHI